MNHLLNHLNRFPALMTARSIAQALDLDDDSAALILKDLAHLSSGREAAREDVYQYVKSRSNQIENEPPKGQ